ncbi:unnamed protein product [Blepharisma stoltei]|uniref:Ribosomal protein S18 n=1 Tax=Blepharisma stoltei TaxID=1481888 RepID=A0AAU9J831_9CILI|nr:unnamed protein product [Blepharisma stoltei]
MHRKCLKCSAEYLDEPPLQFYKGKQKKLQYNYSNGRRKIKPKDTCRRFQSKKKSRKIPRVKRISWRT